MKNNNKKHDESFLLNEDFYKNLFIIIYILNKWFFQLLLIYSNGSDNIFKKRTLRIVTSIYDEKRNKYYKKNEKIVFATKPLFE